MKASELNRLIQEFHLEIELHPRVDVVQYRTSCNRVIFELMQGHGIKNYAFEVMYRNGRLFKYRSCDINSNGETVNAENDCISFQEWQGFDPE